MIAKYLIPAALGLGLTAASAAASPGDDDLAPPPAPKDTATITTRARVDQPDLYVAAGASAILMGVSGGHVDVGLRLASSSVWVKGHVGRMIDLGKDEEMSHPFTEGGVGLELRRCRWPAFTCGAVGTMAVATTEGGAAVVPYVDGELGMGQLALRVGLHGRIGDGADGIGASAGVVFRY